MAGIGSIDDRAAEEYFASGGDPGSILGNPGTEFIWGGGGLVDAWPSNGSEGEYGRVQRSEVETLLVGGTLDFATPAKGATEEVLPKLPKGDQVVLAELGHTTDFWSYDPAASTRLLNTYFDTGEVDDSGYENRTMDFEPQVSNTALAKGLFWSFIGFAVITLVSHLLMWRRVRRGGSFGPKGGAALSSIFTLVLGFGGWFLALLSVLTVWPTLPLDNPVLAVLPIGVPIGLGVYLAWVNRDWSPGFKRAGFWIAMVGALVGAALGFYAGTGLLALITSIVGAAIGANLPLILRDISWDRSLRDRFAGARPAEAA
jgi:TAP-like protein